MKIIVDAMGGDNAPEQIVKGAIEANRDFGCDIILVGRGEAILKAMDRQGFRDLPSGVEIIHADQVIHTEDNPANAFREKKDSSLTVALNLLRDGVGDAVVSAGSTGALLSAATLITKRIKGIRRAALAPLIPTEDGAGAVLIDCGANVECTAEYLLQFAFMGSYYAERVLHRPEPRVALLNNGAEATKGPSVYQEAYKLLQTASDAGRINFIGNVEGPAIIRGQADVVVCDGFAGNILLKGMEGMGTFVIHTAKGLFYKNFFTKLAAALLKKHIVPLAKKLDSRETGGTALLGISKPVIKAHGSSDAYALRNAIRQAISCTEAALAEDIAENIDFMRLNAEA